ncbi:MAG: energy transducer TonB [Ferruginibacter sp.]
MAKASPEKIYFPEQYKIVNSDKAVVVVSFMVNEEGKVEDVEVTTPFYPGFNKIAKNAITSSPDLIPAVNHNRKVRSWMRQTVTFEQSE